MRYKPIEWSILGSFKHILHRQLRNGKLGCPSSIETFPLSVHMCISLNVCLSTNFSPLERYNKGCWQVWNLRTKEFANFFITTNVQICASFIKPHSIKSGKKCDTIWDNFISQKNFQVIISMRENYDALTQVQVFLNLITSMSELICSNWWMLKHFFKSTLN